MCEPTTIALAASTMATVVQGVSAYQQGKAQNAAAKYNARQMENEAIRTRNKGVEAENIHREKVAQLAAQQTAQSAASGVDVMTGSAYDLRQDTAMLGEIDAQRIRDNYLTEAQAKDDQAALTRWEGKQAQKSGTLALGMSVLSAGAGVASKWFTPASAASSGYTGVSSNLADGSRFSIGL